MNFINALAISGALLSVSAVNASSTFGETPYPDSISMGGNLPLGIQHKVAGKMIGGNPLRSTIYGSWSSWETSSHMTNCTTWTPHPSTIKWGEEFAQSNLCDAEETRERTVIYTYSNGSTREEIEYETSITQVDDEQYSVGTKDYIKGDKLVYGGVLTDHVKRNCSSWTPDASTVFIGETFTQSRNCSVNYWQEMTTYNVWASGKETKKSSNVKRWTKSIADNRTASGTRQPDPGGGTNCPACHISGMDKKGMSANPVREGAWDWITLF